MSVDVTNTVQALLSAALERTAAAGGAGAWGMLLLYGALYGVVIAALSGHRKLLLAAYFFSEDARPGQGVLAGAAAAVLQVGTAAVIVFVAEYGRPGSSMAVLGNASSSLARITGGLIGALGLVILILRVLEYIRTRGDWHEQKYISKLRPLDKRIDPDNEDPSVQLAAAHSRQLRRRRRSEAPWLPVVILAAVAPSPGAAAMLASALGRGAAGAGLAAVAAMTLGVAGALIALSLIVILGKERLIDALGSRTAHFTHLGLEVAGALALLGLAVSLLT